MAAKKENKGIAKGKSEGKGDESSRPVSCTGPECKAMAARFGFCSEHFEQFKFGLITKQGKRVPDYDKKIEHYEAFKAKQSARQVA